MKKIFFILLAITGISIFSISNSNAQALTFDVVNNTGFTLVDIYVTPAEQSTWGNDILPYDLFENGSTVTVTIPEGYGETCMFDMKITDTAGNYVTFSNIDACKIIKLQINGDGTFSYLTLK